MAVYLRQCFPTVEQIVERVGTILREEVGKELKSVYIMTNGERDWLAELKIALRHAYPWEHVVSSRDMTWTPEQKYVGQATDMLIGERADVFIGNGVSAAHRQHNISRRSDVSV